MWLNSRAHQDMGRISESLFESLLLTWICLRAPGPGHVCLWVKQLRPDAMMAQSKLWSWLGLEVACCWMGNQKNYSICSCLEGGWTLTQGDHPRFTLWKPWWARKMMLQHHPSYKGCGVSHHGDKQKVSWVWVWNVVTSEVQCGHWGVAWPSESCLKHLTACVCLGFS